MPKYNVALNYYDTSKCRENDQGQHHSGRGQDHVGVRVDWAR